MNLLSSPWNWIFFLGFLVYLRIRGVYAARVKKEDSVHRRIDKLELFLLILVIPGSLVFPLMYLFTPFLSFADYQLPAFAPWLGTAVMLLGLWLFWRSHADLGRNWSVSLEVRKDHQIVKSGVYKTIRHPMYSAIFLFSIAQGLLLANWLAGWYALLAFGVMYIVRTPREEKMMCEFFGEQYQDYMKETWRLFPKW